MPFSGPPEPLITRILLIPNFPDTVLQEAAVLFLLLQSYHFTGLDRPLELQKVEAPSIDNPVCRNVLTLFTALFISGTLMTRYSLYNFR